MNMHIFGWYENPVKMPERLYVCRRRLEMNKNRIDVYGTDLSLLEALPLDWLEKWDSRVSKTRPFFQLLEEAEKKYIMVKTEREIKSTLFVILACVTALIVLLSLLLLSAGQNRLFITTIGTLTLIGLLFYQIFSPNGTIKDPKMTDNHTFTNIWYKMETFKAFFSPFLSINGTDGSLYFLVKDKESFRVLYTQVAQFILGLESSYDQLKQGEAVNNPTRALEILQQLIDQRELILKLQFMNEILDIDPDMVKAVAFQEAARHLLQKNTQKTTEKKD